MTYKQQYYCEICFAFVNVRYDQNDIVCDECDYIIATTHRVEVEDSPGWWSKFKQEYGAFKKARKEFKQVCGRYDWYSIW